MQPFTSTCSKPPASRARLIYIKSVREVESRCPLQDHPSQFQDELEKRKRVGDSWLENKTRASPNSKLLSPSMFTRHLCLVDGWTGVWGNFPDFNTLILWFPYFILLICTESKVGGMSGRLSKCHHETPNCKSGLLFFNQ